MVKRSDIDHGFFLVIVALLSWAVPGAGHFIIKERKRGVVIFVTITLTFLVGIYVGSIGVINPTSELVWYMAQILTSPFVGMIAQASNTGEYVSYGRPCDIGQIYTSIAGLLNLLCVVSAVYMAHCGRGEIIGEDEDAQ